MITWGEYLCRGATFGGPSQLEVKPQFDPGMYKKGVNENFYNLENRPADVVVTDFRKRFENAERDIARSEADIVAMLAAHGTLTTGCRVVDFGSGTGLFLRALSQHVGPTGLVFATEISEVFSRFLRQRVVTEPLPNVRVIFNQDPRNPNLEGMQGQVDLVFVCDVYHHLEYPLTTMRHLRRALKPDGRLVVIDFIRDSSVHTSHPETPDWILKHVRAPQETFRAEIISCGFELVAEPPCAYLPENYIMIFRPLPKEAWGQQVGTGWGTRR